MAAAVNHHEAWAIFGKYSEEVACDMACYRVVAGRDDIKKIHGFSFFSRPQHCRYRLYRQEDGANLEGSTGAERQLENRRERLSAANSEIIGLAGRRLEKR
jgi:hypothetical protein